MNLPTSQVRVSVRRHVLDRVHLMIVLMLAAAVSLSRVEAEENDQPVADGQRTTDEIAQPPGLGDPGRLVELRPITGWTSSPIVLRGRDAGQQIIIEGRYDSGQTRDLTREVSFSVSPESVARIDATGYVTPLSEGTAIVTATVSPDAQDGTNDARAANPTVSTDTVSTDTVSTDTVSTDMAMQCQVSIEVRHIKQDPRVNFPNQIVPVFTKYGCNGGGCHGKSGGQNGFALSLLGFEPTEDYEYLVKEGRGRRVFPAAPDRSLLLTKATGTLPHGGGQRLTSDSPAYRLLRRWIAQGMPYGNATDPVVERIEVQPRQRVMPRDGQQQLVVVAHYSDGSTEDITRMTQFESNDTEMSEVNVTGLVTTSRLTGSVAVMARYQGHVDVFRATIPLGVQVASLPPAQNYIDELVFRNLQQLGLPASPICDDATFLRRVTIDLAGRLPTLDEVDAFMSDADANKRSQLVDRLLASTDYADYFANKWNAILRNKRSREEDKVATFAFHDWIRESFLNNKPYDEFVREIVTASGETGKNPPVAWYREVNDQAAQVEDTAQLFLGMRIQCARCHHHPFEKWSQQDYYGFAAFFSQVGRKRGALPGETRIFKQRVVPQAKNPKNGDQVPPTGLGSQPLIVSPDEDARHLLVDWMADPDNPFFARAFVNRYWNHFFGRGLVDPEDDMRVTNPACNPELLDSLARDFVDSDFDIKQLIRNICNSSTYQLSALPNDWNEEDRQNFSRFYPRRLNAEVLLDAINQVTHMSTSFGGLPTGTRAVELPDNGFDSYFLTVFGRPESASACECERSGDANLAQSLHLLNSREIQDKLSSDASRVHTLAAEASRPHEARIRELYLRVFSREPAADELSIATEYVDRHQDDLNRAYEDLVWVLVNTKEFMFNH